MARKSVEITEVIVMCFAYAFSLACSDIGSFERVCFSIVLSRML